MAALLLDLRMHVWDYRHLRTDVCAPLVPFRSRLTRTDTCGSTAERTTLTP